MTDTQKICPICDARNHRNAVLCNACGTTIVEVASQQDADDSQARAPLYDYRYGETDLAEASLTGKGRIFSVVLVAMLLTVAGAVAVAWRLSNHTGAQPVSLAQIPTQSPTRVMAPSITPGTPTATFTISPVPSPTPSETSTPSPCIRKAADGDSLIAIILRCGHSDLSILPTVMAINGIADETRIQIGQEISVPHPSATAAPDSTPETEDSAAANTGEDELTRLAFDPFAPTLTPTLLPGLQWYFVKADEDMIYVAAIHDINIKTLADLNPEIEFSLCDFGEIYGGPECTVQLFVNQQIRVPAPEATATASVAAFGGNTPTPTATATFNAPLAQSPADEAFYSPLEQVTLRWVGTGALGANQVYRIALTNIDSGAQFAAETQELYFIIPATWQSPNAGSHRYSWQISVANSDTGLITYSSETRTFVWQGLGQVEP